MSAVAGSSAHLTFFKKIKILNTALSFIAAMSFVVVLSSCDSGTQWKSGTYEVYWIDVDLVLGLDLGDGNSIGRVMHKVSAVGEDDTWIVAERHPNGDESITTYHYWAKTSDHPHKNADEVVLGPFTESEFLDIKKRLKLPEFSKRF